jgi:hypothetical protein
VWRLGKKQGIPSWKRNRLLCPLLKNNIYNPFQPPFMSVAPLLAEQGREVVKGGSLPFIKEDEK